VTGSRLAPWSPWWESSPWPRIRPEGRGEGRQGRGQAGARAGRGEGGRLSSECLGPQPACGSLLVGRVVGLFQGVFRLSSQCSFLPFPNCYCPLLFPGNTVTVLHHLHACHLYPRPRTPSSRDVRPWGEGRTAATFSGAFISRRLLQYSSTLDHSMAPSTHLRLRGQTCLPGPLTAPGHPPGTQGDMALGVLAWRARRAGLLD
jgi:hypothetical protein